MASFLIFVIVGVVPLAIYFINSMVAMKDKRGIAAGIPKPKTAKAPRHRTREAKVRQRRAQYCGRNFAHLALALVGSQDSCKYCTYLQEVPPPPPPSADDDDHAGEDDTNAAVRAAEEIIDRAKH
ncbi:MAG: hypothetical protein AB7N24_07400 [Dehalococcoidia bacterium]